jgi:polar amino acid transport system permease protein
MLDFNWIPEYALLFWQGLQTTILLLLLSGGLGLTLAACVALARLSSKRWLALPSLVFTQAIRGTPLLVQIFLLYYGVGSFFATNLWIRESFFWPYLRDGFWYIVLALTLSVGAYVGEVIRTGLKAVPRGEIEAARALGMGYVLMMRRIWLPRALQILLPTLAGESVLLLKSTALASTVAVTDLLGAANYVRAQTLITYEPLITVAVVYLLLAWLIEHGFRLLEKKIPSRTQA